VRWMVTSKGVEENFTDTVLREVVGVKGRPILVDIQGPGEEDFKLLESVLGLHALTIEDMRHEGNAPSGRTIPATSSWS
jgi:Mg2+ and Co2+ transporter CorA